MQDVPPQHRREGPVRVRQHARPQLAPAARDLRDHRINAVRRGPGHQADEELGSAFRLALNLHG